MKYTLRSYQHKAAKGVLATLQRAMRNYRSSDHTRSSFTLSAATSAGKTVIAAAVIEALFNGSDDLGVVEPDSNAVVLWLTDDESLNNQTRRRFMLSSELDVSQLVSISTSDFPDVLERQTVYFLNVQKLNDSSVKYSQPSESRSYSLWDTLRNTIEDTGRNFYLVLDEAHKGMGGTKTTIASRTTTVQRVINGDPKVGMPPVPVVWGISATIDRFKHAMSRAENRDALSDIKVPIDEVRDSGLLKDTIRLQSGNAAALDTTLLRHAVERTVEQDGRWATYCAEQGIEPPVVPLLVVQVPNAPSEAELKRYVSTIQEEWRRLSTSDLDGDAMVHVFSDHADMDLAGRTVRHVEPETIQDSPTIRVLLAKNAVTTGWDCPRAEVLVSMRGSTDKTVITQLIGRMVRTPLAHSVASDLTLNTVTCLLPKFNHKTTEDVVTMLTGGKYNGPDEPEGGGIDVLAGPTVILERNPQVRNEVFKIFGNLPSERKPDPEARPVDRLLKLAMQLAGDSINGDAIAQANERLLEKLDGIMAEHAKDVEKNVGEIEKAQLAGWVVSLKGAATERDDVVVVDADRRAVDAAFAAASKVMGKAIALRYQKRLANQNVDEDGEPDDMGAKLKVAALARVPGVGSELASRATEMFNEWLQTYDVSIGHVKDGNAVKRAEYDSLSERLPEEMNRNVQPELPERKEEAEGEYKLGEDGKAEIDANGKAVVIAFPTYDKHLLSTSDGKCPFRKLNEWEKSVLDMEMNRNDPEIVGWYRNPSQPTANAIRIPYRKDDGSWSSLQPDFVFFTRKKDGGIAASLLEPHRDFGDSLPKLRGLADFVDRHPGMYVRVEMLTKVRAGTMKKLDLTDKAVRDAVRASTSAEALFIGDLAKEYR